MMSYLKFENIYDKYCSMLYGIALQICYSNENEAEELLTSTFKKVKEQDINQEKYPAYCITLIRIILKTAQEHYPLKFKYGFRLKQFEDTPLINQLFCKQISLQDYCKEKSITNQEALQILRKEFSVIRAFEKRK